MCHVQKQHSYRISLPPTFKLDQNNHFKVKNIQSHMKNVAFYVAILFFRVVQNATAHRPICYSLKNDGRTSIVGPNSFVVAHLEGVEQRGDVDVAHLRVAGTKQSWCLVVIGAILRLSDSSLGSASNLPSKYSPLVPSKTKLRKTTCT